MNLSSRSLKTLYTFKTVQFFGPPCICGSFSPDPIAGFKRPLRGGGGRERKERNEGEEEKREGEGKNCIMAVGGMDDPDLKQIL